jgi:Glyoxalase-like domain
LARLGCQKQLLGWYGQAMKTQIDHLVVVAQTLAQGVQWCEATLGITPGPGGEHPQHGTHNRLFKIATPTHPLAYLEIIAIDPAAKRPVSSTAKRWFDMDDPALQVAVATEPRLVHFVANTTDIQAARQALKAQGIERGPAVQASRHSRRGVLQWQITVREDGQRLFNGALPSLIQWGKPEAAEPLRLHPRNSLPRSGVTLQSLAVTHPTAPKLQAAYEALGLGGIPVDTGPANLIVTLHTPRGEVQLQSHGI